MTPVPLDMKRFGTLALCAAFSLMFMGIWLPAQAQDTPKATAKATDKTKKTPGFIQKLADEADTLGSAKKSSQRSTLGRGPSLQSRKLLFCHRALQECPTL